LSSGGATTPVHELLGLGPELYRLFSRGLTIAQATDVLVTSTGTRRDIVEQSVITFAQSLVDAKLAEPVT
jgi:hypothetical protein